MKSIIKRYFHKKRKKKFISLSEFFYFSTKISILFLYIYAQIQENEIKMAESAMAIEATSSIKPSAPIPVVEENPAIQHKSIESLSEDQLEQLRQKAVFLPSHMQVS